MIARPQGWVNYVELKAVFPDVDGVEVITAAGLKSMDRYLVDKSREFDFRPSKRFVGHIEAIPLAGKAD